ncbi:hypothetical protein GCM10027174_09670 [Salinifilum aidingensis]
MPIYSAMTARDPDFFPHSGDTVYAGGPVSESVTLPDGREWRNIVTPGKSKVAETLAEFRGQFASNPPRTVQLQQYCCWCSSSAKFSAPGLGRARLPRGVPFWGARSERGGFTFPGRFDRLRVDRPR